MRSLRGVRERECVGMRCTRRFVHLGYCLFVNRWQQASVHAENALAEGKTPENWGKMAACLAPVVQGVKRFVSTVEIAFFSSGDFFTAEVENLYLAHTEGLECTLKLLRIGRRELQ